MDYSAFRMIKNEITENKGAVNTSGYQLNYITQATEKVTNIHK
jgi:hypothetical protein